MILNAKVTPIGKAREFTSRDGAKQFATPLRVVWTSFNGLSSNEERTVGDCYGELDTEALARHAQMGDEIRVNIIFDIAEWQGKFYAKTKIKLPKEFYRVKS